MLHKNIDDFFPFSNKKKKKNLLFPREHAKVSRELLRRSAIEAQVATGKNGAFHALVGFRIQVAVAIITS